MDKLTEERKRIDETDRLLIDIIAERMNISRRIGEYKSEYGIDIIQPERYTAMLKQRIEQGKNLKIDERFISSLFDLIHEESQKVQTAVINSKKTTTKR